MVLEATLLVLDNSDWMRNGDYSPCRIDAQADAAQLIFSAKTQSNPENAVGIMTMSGKCPQVLLTLTNNLGKILAALHQVSIGGNSHFSQSLQTAQLVLKNRQNKNQRQRIIVFVASPLLQTEDEKSLLKLAKKLKKNNVAVDIIHFGQESSPDSISRLQSFIDTVNSNDTSHFVSVPPGNHILSDALLTTPIIAGEDGAGFAMGGGSSGFEFGMDPSLDPDLALALKLSMEEERARQEQGQLKQGGKEGGDKMDISDDSALLERALAMSMQQSGGGGDGDVDMTEEEQIAHAIQMSMGSGTSGNVLQSVLESLPGVDPTDARFNTQQSVKDDKNSKTDNNNNNNGVEKKKDEEKK